jgi:hypothetical protein
LKAHCEKSQTNFETKSAEPPGDYFPLVHDELKRLAASRLEGERAAHSLDATALVHQA